MSDLISRRAVTFSGDIADSNYDSERYYVGGVDLTDEMLDLQKQVFPFARQGSNHPLPDQGVGRKFAMPVTLAWSVMSALAQANTALAVLRVVDEVSFTGRLIEGRRRRRHRSPGGSHG